MGYTTDFRGSFQVTPALSQDHIDYLNKFSDSRRMKRDTAKILDRKTVWSQETLRTEVEGEFYVDAGGICGQTRSSDIVDYNTPPTTQPGLWCQWVPTEDGEGIEWNGCEKFYAYVEWLEYIIKNFLAPSGYKLNGSVDWRGEEWDDIGTIIITDNNVAT